MLMLISMQVVVLVLKLRRYDNECALSWGDFIGQLYWLLAPLRSSPVSTVRYLASQSEGILSCIQSIIGAQTLLAIKLSGCSWWLVAGSYKKEATGRHRARHDRRRCNAASVSVGEIRFVEENALPISCLPVDHSKIDSIESSDNNNKVTCSPGSRNKRMSVSWVDLKMPKDVGDYQ